jgi:hypothetical protein
MYTRVWTDAVLGSNPANTIDTLLANIRGDLNERLTDLFTISSFTADPLVATAIKLNRTVDSKILGGTTSFAIRDAADTFNCLYVDTVGGNVSVRAGLSVGNGLSVLFGGHIQLQDNTLASYNVLAGDPDSGGVGYRLLRVANAFNPF